MKDLESQNGTLCNLVDNENLRAVLRNKTLPSDLSSNFIYWLVKSSKTDNGQVVSILLENSRCNVTVHHLEKCLRKDLTAMAAVKMNASRKIFKCVELAPTNVGCYWCTNENGCVIFEDAARYCIYCVSDDERNCQSCNDYLCPSCFEGGLYETCEKCGKIECLHEYCQRDFLNNCQICTRKKCKPCVYGDGEVWSTMEDYQVKRCPMC
jgi:hypothetical protein